MKMIALFFVLSFAPICCLAQGPAETVNPHEATTKATYLVIYRPGSAWLCCRLRLRKRFFLPD